MRISQIKKVEYDDFDCAFLAGMGLFEYRLSCLLGEKKKLKSVEAIKFAKSLKTLPRISTRSTPFEPKPINYEKNPR